MKSNLAFVKVQMRHKWICFLSGFPKIKSQQETDSCSMTNVKGSIYIVNRGYTQEIERNE